MIAATPRAILFDLDQTLVDSSALGPLRDARKWLEVMIGIETQVQPIRSKLRPGLLAHQLPARLAAKGYRVGIVSSAPRVYANAVFAKLGIDGTSSVCEFEGGALKPDPAPILCALKALDVRPEEAVYVGDAHGDFQAAYAAGVKSVGAFWAVSSPIPPANAPDVHLTDPAQLLDPTLLPRLGYVAEVVLAGNKPALHEGSFLWCGPDQVALGRYYPAKAPDEHAASTLTQCLLALRGGSQGLAPWIAACLSWPLAKKIPLAADGWTFVPPKPLEADRFEAIGLEFGRGWKGRIPSIRSSALERVRDVPMYRGMSAVEREEAIRGAFQVKEAWRGKRALIVDDVFTSGGTLNDCSRALKEAGVQRVGGIALAVDQRGFGQRRCPKCGGAVTVSIDVARRERALRCTGTEAAPCDFLIPWPCAAPPLGPPERGLFYSQPKRTSRKRR